MMASLWSSSFILMSALQILLVVAQDINANINKVWVLQYNSHHPRRFLLIAYFLVTILEFENYYFKTRKETLVTKLN